MAARGRIGLQPGRRLAEKHSALIRPARTTASRRFPHRPSQVSDRAASIAQWDASPGISADSHTQPIRNRGRPSAATARLQPELGPERGLQITSP